MNNIAQLKHRSQMLIGMGIFFLVATTALSIVFDANNEYGFITIILSVLSGAMVGEGFLTRQRAIDLMAAEESSQ